MEDSQDYSVAEIRENPTKAKSCRPVSLLYPAVEKLEKLLLPDIVEHSGNPSYQHGFKKLHFIVTALNQLNSDIAVGFTYQKPVRRTTIL